MKSERKPWVKWYFADWRADPRLRMCSLAARGLWVDLLGYCHEADPYGFLLVEGVAPTVGEIAGLVGRPEKEIRNALAELERFGVFSRDDAGRIYSRRMLRDKAKADADRENGKRGGNPSLVDDDKATVNGGVNHEEKTPDKAHMPEARGQRRQHQQREKREPRARAPRTPKTPIPEGFGISDRVRQWAAEKGHDRLDERLEHFVGYAKRSGAAYADWGEAFMSAVREDWAKLNGKPAPNAAVARLTPAGQRSAENLREWLDNEGGRNGTEG